MTSIDGENSPHVSYTEYDKNANPFYPSSYKYSYLIKFSNLPLDVDKSNLANLLDSIIMKKFGKFNTPINKYNIVEFRNNNVRNGDQQNFAIIEIQQWEFGVKLIEILNGYEWQLKQLEAKLITNDMYDNQNYVRQGNNPYYSHYSNFPYTPVARMNYNYMHPPQNSAQVHQIPHQNNYPNTYMSTRSSKSSDSRRNSRSSNSSSIPLPSFITNLVNENTGDYGDNKSETTNENTLPATNEFIIVKNDEGQSIKVNPCRLFIGNIPFSSTWTTLKDFLILHSEEIEPGNYIKILRVEIPMQLLTSQFTSNTASNTGLNVNLNKLNNYQFLSSFISGNIDNSDGISEDQNTQPSRGLSRGFAIVTTGNKESLDKLIEYFDNVEFESRSLTVRYDKFPDFNNYILQQLNPDNNRNSFIQLSISNLAFERNLFQQTFYYGNAGYAPMLNSYLPYPVYYNSPMYYPSMNYAGPATNILPPQQYTHQYSSYIVSPLNEYNQILSPNYSSSNSSSHDIPRHKINPSRPNAYGSRRNPPKQEDTCNLASMKRPGN